MSSSDTAWYDAQQTCFDYLCVETDSKSGVNAFIGNRLWDDKVNLWCFIVSGGPTQIQNYQAPMPGKKYLTNAVLRGQYAHNELKSAMALAGRIQNNMPAYKDVENPGQASGHVKNRGIPPNVSLFEVTDHPLLFSDVVETEENGKTTIKQFWIVIVNFRIAYTNGKT